MTEWSLIRQKTFYLEVKTKLPDYWEDGLLKKGDEIVDYTEILGWDEPMGNEDTELLPSGVTYRDAKWFYSEVSLKTYLDYDDMSQYCDRIFLQDPRVFGKKAKAYEVYGKEDYGDSDGFTLLDSSHDYIIVKEGKL